MLHGGDLIASTRYIKGIERVIGRRPEVHRIRLTWKGNNGVKGDFGIWIPEYFAKKASGGICSPKVLSRVLRLATVLAERAPTDGHGSLILVGDSARIMKNHARQLAINARTLKGKKYAMAMASLRGRSVLEPSYIMVRQGGGNYEGAEVYEGKRGHITGYALSIHPNLNRDARPWWSQALTRGNEADEFTNTGVKDATALLITKNVRCVAIGIKKTGDVYVYRNGKRIGVMPSTLIKMGRPLFIVGSDMEKVTHYMNYNRRQFLADIMVILRLVEGL